MRLKWDFPDGFTPNRFGETTVKAEMKMGIGMIKSDNEENENDGNDDNGDEKVRLHVVISTI